jgi:tetratricopeptide (TPR) repeat protein
MGVRELKEAALDLYARRRFADCARTYGKLIQLEPSDPHLHVRHAEAWRRAGERTKAIAAYRAAAELLLLQGCESRARAALKVAQELAPEDLELARAVERLTPTYGPRREEVRLPSSIPEHQRDMVELHTRAANVPGRLALPPVPGAPRAPSRSPVELRRLSSNTLAIRAAPGMRWVVVSSRTPLTAYEVDDVERVTSREFTLEVTVVAEE